MSFCTTLTHKQEKGFFRLWVKRNTNTMKGNNYEIQNSSEKYKITDSRDRLS